MAKEAPKPSKPYGWACQHKYRPNMPDYVKILATINLLVAHAYGIDPAPLRSASRKATLIEPRRVAWKLAREEFQVPSKAIGTVFLRNHSSVLVGVQSFDAQLAKSVELRGLYEELRSMVREALKDNLPG